MNPITWLEDGGEVVWPRVLLLALVCVTVLALGIVAATSTTAFGLYNPGWDGSSDLRDSIATDPDVDSDLVRDPSAYERFASESEANGTVAFVVAPEDAYDEADAERVRTFVENGGRLVVFENFGDAGNELLAEVGARARADGRVLRDEHQYENGPAMPVATGVENHSLADGIDEVTLNYATAVDPGNEETSVLVTTGPVASLGDHDGSLDDEDVLGTYPVATVENVSAGQVVVVGDPSLTINEMRPYGDNAAFVRGLYADADTVVFDVSHVDDVPPLTAAVLTLRDTPLLQVLVGLLGLVPIAALSDRRTRSIASRLLRAPRRWLVPGPRGAPVDDGSTPGLSSEERIAFLRRTRPEWNEDRIRRVAQAVDRTDGTRETDD